MTLNGVMADTLRYFTEFGKPLFWLTHNRVDLWRNLCMSLLFCSACVRCRRKESSRSLSHLLTSFLFYLHECVCLLTQICLTLTTLYPSKIPLRFSLTNLLCVLLFCPFLNQSGIFERYTMHVINVKQIWVSKRINKSKIPYSGVSREVSEWVVS